MSEKMTTSNEIIADADANWNGPITLKDAIAQCFNCREIDVDEGDVWIANPQAGHWLDPVESERLVAFLREQGFIR